MVQAETSGKVIIGIGMIILALAIIGFVVFAVFNFIPADTKITSLVNPENSALFFNLIKS